jgi:hypothetical protein
MNVLKNRHPHTTEGANQGHSNPTAMISHAVGDY